MDANSLRKRIALLLWFFVVALAVSGLTAFPLRWEIGVLHRMLGPGTAIDRFWPAMAGWIGYVSEGLTTVFERYPFIAYGTDWLAFAHLVIAVAFLGAIRDPVRNVWVVEFGMIACIMVIPLAMICGPLRGIPFFWRLFDCAFGVFGIIPLWLVRRDIRRLAAFDGGTRVLAEC